MTTYWLSFRLGESAEKSAYDDRYRDLVGLIKGYQGRVWQTPTSLLIFETDLYDLDAIKDHISKTIDVSKDVVIIGEVGSRRVYVLPKSKAGNASQLLELID
jgi:hypothetical protein